MKKNEEIKEQEMDAYRRKCLDLIFSFQEWVDSQAHLSGLEKAREQYLFQELMNRLNRAPHGGKILFRG